MGIFGLGGTKRGLANADEATRKRVARQGGKAHKKRR
jgi:hypothetical protein